jgi:tetratricopeptide (TPR) repeat protein
MHEALEFLNKHRPILQRNTVSIYNIGILLYKCKKYESALSVFESIQFDPNKLLSCKSMIMLGKIHEYIQRTEQAMGYYAKAQMIHFSAKLDLHMRLMEVTSVHEEKIKPVVINREVLKEIKVTHFFIDGFHPP